MSLYLFANAIYRLALDRNPDFVLNMNVSYLVLGVLGFFLGDLYYKPLKALMKAKQDALA